MTENKTQQQNHLNGQALASLVTGLLAGAFMLVVPLLGLLLGAAGMILGSISLAKIKKNQESGLILALLGLVTSVLAVLFFISILVIGLLLRQG
ncbi:hypothetical protein ACFPU1_02305 [Thalassorhabdus alkalitolerans]|uniref:DUF4190 domain-containing protein n=1 Tax=Thalassorhabdus alkalitolerans TaxID=2282697 RepID=A0ABW0YGP9_9BACI